MKRLLTISFILLAGVVRSPAPIYPSSGYVGSNILMQTTAAGVRSAIGAAAVGEGGGVSNNYPFNINFGGAVTSTQFNGSAFGLTNVTADSERPRPQPAKVNDWAALPTVGTSNGMGFTYVDVVALETNWNGFKYWAGISHHPRYGWSNPTLLCSPDGYNWQVPAGATNPWYVNLSEPGLGIVLNTNGQLYCYTARQTNGWSLLLQRTSDGVNRTAPVIVSSNAARHYDFPSAIQEANGDISVWSTYNDGIADYGLGIYYQRFGTSGTNLIAGPMLVNGLTNLFNRSHAAHVSVRRVGDYYYAATKMQDDAAGNVQMNPYALFASLDATNWFMVQDTILNPVDYPKYPNYTQGPNSQGGLSSAARWWGIGLGRVRQNSGTPRLDLWAVTGMDDQAFTNAHQICYYSDVAIPHNKNTIQAAGLVIDNGGDTLMSTRPYAQIQIGGGDNGFRIRKEYSHDLTLGFGALGGETSLWTFQGDNGNLVSSLFTGSGNGLTATYRAKNWSLTNLFTRANVKEFGAIGNGIADDTAAIQAAIWYCTTNAAYVYPPPGRYKITAPLYIPPAGGSSLTNRITIRGDAWMNTIFLSQSTNTPAIYAPGSPTQQGCVGLFGLWITGPTANDLVLGAAPYYAYKSNYPYAGARGVVIGQTNTYAGGGLASFETEIESCRIDYFEYGLMMTNCANAKVSESWIQSNAKGNVVLAHCDSFNFKNMHGGYMLVTNRTELVFSYYNIGTPWSTWGGGTKADSGVNKIFENFEHHEPFLYDDSGRCQIKGGQFEIAINPSAPLIYGWCHFTNTGQRSFDGATINIASPNTNSFLFSLHNGASGGLSLRNCSLNGEDDPLFANPRDYLFDIYREGSDATLYPPYWDSQATGPTTPADQESNKNARLDGTNYIHIKQRGADTLNQDTLRRNGRQLYILNVADGHDKNGAALQSAAHTEGPFKANMQTYFNDANDLMYGWAVCYAPNVTGFSPWYFQPLEAKTNLDGVMPLNYRFTVSVLCTNVFTNNFTLDGYCLKNGGSQTAGGSGSWGYYSTTTNLQQYEGTLTFAAPPTSPISIRWGVNAAAWAITNRFFFFNPRVEAW